MEVMDSATFYFCLIHIVLFIKVSIEYVLFMTIRIENEPELDKIIK